MAASNPLHRDASASRQPSTHSLHGITASNAALLSRRLEGRVGPLRPWSGSRSCGAPPRPRPLPFARASRADARTKTGACGRTVRTPPCNRILEATTMRRTARIKNKMRTPPRARRKGVKRDRTGCPPSYGLYGTTLSLDDRPHSESRHIFLFKPANQANSTHDVGVCLLCARAPLPRPITWADRPIA